MKSKIKKEFSHYSNYEEFLSENRKRVILNDIVHSKYQ